MAENLGEAVLHLTTDGSKLSHGLKTAEGETQSFSSKAGGALGSFGKTAALAGGAAGVGALTFALKTGWDEWNQHQKVAAQTEAVLKSTGAAAGVTSKHIEDLAGNIMKYSGTDDEAIQSGENLLLTFTNIRNEVGKGNDIFDQSTGIMVDMSRALGQDMKTSAIQLGKALNDPVKGISALRRVGVSFTEQQQWQIKTLVAGSDALTALGLAGAKMTPIQEDMAKKMAEHGASAAEVAKTLHLKLTPAQLELAQKMQEGGHLLEAQKIILGELKTEVGGSAEAYGKTFPGQLAIFHEKFNNVMGDVINKAVQFIKLHWDEISKALKEIGDDFVTFGHVAGQVIEFIRPLIEMWAKNLIAILNLISDLLHGDFSGAWRDIKDLVGNTINGILGYIQNLADLAYSLLNAIGGDLVRGLWDGIQSGWTTVSTFFTNIGTTIQQFFTGCANWLVDKGKAIIQGLHDGVLWVWQNVIVAWYVDLPKKILGYFADAGSWLVGKGKETLHGLADGFVDGWEKASGWLASMGGRVTNAVTGATDWLAGHGKAAIIGLKNGAVEGWNAVSDWFGALPSRIGHAVLNGAQDGIGLIKQAFGKLFGWLPGWAKDILGISSPSKAFKEIGENIIHGLIKGFEGMGGKLKDKAQELIVSPIDWVAQTVSGIGSDIWNSISGAVSGVVSGGSGAGSPASNRALGAALAQDKFGWGANEFASLDALFNQESGWNQYAKNPSSGAYGIPQALPPTKMPFAAQEAGGSSPYEQIMWGLQYIKDRYGDPINAWSGYWARGGWYGSGLDMGVFNRPTLIGVGDRGPEAVSVQPLSGVRARSGGGWPETIQLVVDKRVLGEIVRAQNNAYSLSNGLAVPVHT